jgi:tungstate transport system substrate-binding protein
MIDSRLRLAIVACWIAALPACARPQVTQLEIATTTSVVNSGLTESLLPQYTPAQIRVHAAGSGRALQMLETRQVDLIISHAPHSEAAALSRNPGWAYRKLASNRFVIVGPKSDPARLAQTQSAAEAFRRIDATRSPFISRGDESGTHEREKELWVAAGVEHPNVLTGGGSMAVTLRQASERQAYTLTDEATWWQLQDGLQLAQLAAGDPLLLNIYAVIYRPENKVAAAFAEWLSDGAGRELMGAFQIAGRSAFTLWPRNCPRDNASAQPCR